MTRGKVSNITLATRDNCVKFLEFLLGKKINKKYHEKIGRAFHLKTQIIGVKDSLSLMNLKIDDIVYKQDRKVLRSIF